ncbi:MAG: hypothetical protein HC890_09845 [Chloroflexaceae bacterium]|nr:hypothetical protein [Chloroflexaceae bacterium]
MAIYVQSCGVARDQDYRWLKLQSSHLLPEIPPILKRPIVEIESKYLRVADAIDSQSPSLVLARSQGELLLLVTGLEARKERTDFMGRRVRNSLAWIYPDSPSGDRILRALTVLALQNRLAVPIDRAIHPGGDYGFTVDSHALEKFSETADVEAEIENNYNSETRNKLGGDREFLREEIALELQANPLPNKPGFLVMITSIKTEAALREMGVWRGLSSRIESERLTSALAVAETAPPTQKKRYLSQQQWQWPCLSPYSC